jgi:hypothetical protein
MFAVCVAAAVNNSKLNLLLQFEQPPSAAQVLSRSIAAFTQLQQSRGIHTPFFCNCAMIFDDDSSRWVPLERSSQVVHGAQCYIFQPDVADVAGPIPDPIPASSFLVGYQSPPRNINAAQTTYDPSPRGLMPTDPDLSSFNPATRNLDFGDRQYGGGYSSSRAVAAGGGYNDNERNPLSPEQRAILRREAERGGNTFVAGGSILAEERQKEDQKIKLGLDEHRQRVRDETKRFTHDVSPPRQQDKK